MRIAASIFVAAHGLGHIVWFMATWARSSLGGSGRADLAKHEPGFLVPVASIGGRLIGLVSLVVIAGFFASAWGIWTETTWWPPVLLGSVGASMVVLFAIWNPVLTLSVRALLANVGLTLATLMPWGERVLGAH